jgi:uncharacterized protein YndB with AHSA1/START domain
MATANGIIHIERPPEEVWAYLTDFPRNPEWLTQVFEVRVSPGVVGQGTRVTEVRQVPGRQVEGVVEVVEWDPPRRLRKQSPSGGLRADGLYQLEPTSSGGTMLTFTLEVHGTGLLKVAEWLMGLGLQKDTEHVLQNLKQRLEHGKSPPPSSDHTVVERS